jgi:RHS repeat-associated protein
MQATSVLVSDGTTTYAQDLAAPLSQVLSDGTATYLYGHDRLRAQGGPWYIGDALGSVRQTLDDAGAVLGNVQYDPWGTPQDTLSAPFGFTGELHSAGQVYLRARWYAPGNGTFTSRDTWIGEFTRPLSLHKYLYTENNPINAVDPTGFQTFRVWTAAFIAPEKIEFLYQGGDWGVGVWEGDSRSFWDMNGLRPSSRIWAEVTIDTNADNGLLTDSLKSGVGTTAVYFLKDGHVQKKVKVANDEAQVSVTRDRYYILVRLQNWGGNPLTPQGVTPKIHYDYSLVFDLKQKRLIVDGSVTRFPSHELVIQDTMLLGHVPDYAAGANPFDLAPPLQGVSPSVVNLPLQEDVHVDDCLTPNPQAWAILDGQFLMYGIPRFFDRQPWLSE